MKASGGGRNETGQKEKVINSGNNDVEKVALDLVDFGII